MCYPADDTTGIEPRGKGWYCCRDLTWHPESKRICRICKNRRDKETAVAPLPQRRRKIKES